MSKLKKYSELYVFGAVYCAVNIAMRLVISGCTSDMLNIKFGHRYFTFSHWLYLAG